MNAVEAGLVMRRLAAGLGGVEVDPEAVEVWTDLMPGVPADVAAEAVDLYLQSPDEKHRFFPTVAVFQQFVAAAHRERAKAKAEAERTRRGPSRSCSFCGGYGWGEVAPIETVDLPTGEILRWEAWRPCEPCNPIAYDSWLRYCEDQRARARRSGADEGTVASALGAARASLG